MTRTIFTDLKNMGAEQGFQMFRRFLQDDRGGEVLEYALIAGLIVVASIGVIASVGTAVAARWSSLNSSL